MASGRDNSTMENLINLIGYGATEELMRAWGNSRPYIPSPENLRTDHPLVLRVGPYNAERIANEYGSRRLEIPAYSTILRDKRNKKIRAEYRAGGTIEAIAKKHGMNRRTVRSIVRGKKPPCPAQTKTVYKNENQHLPGAKMRKRNISIIDTIVIHGTATPPEMDIGAKEIEKWHKNRKPPFAAIGYHYVIRRNGELETGRRLQEQGAHVRGHNKTSVGIAMVGGVKSGSITKYSHGEPEDNYTREQYETLLAVLKMTVTACHGIRVICGHRDLPGTNTSCPSFDVEEWLCKQASIELLERGIL